jgi:hypothetical protein
MQKELNPDLFGTPHVASKKIEIPTNSTPQVLEQKYLETKQSISALAQQMQSMATQFVEFQKSTQLKIERLAQVLGKLEHSHQTTTVEAAGKIAHLNQRLGERKTLDQKMQELVDRHNSVLKGFEVRITHLQKLLSEKDGQVMSAFAALNEAKMEIARLKRL